MPMTWKIEACELYILTHNQTQFNQSIATVHGGFESGVQPTKVCVGPKLVHFQRCGFFLQCFISVCTSFFTLDKTAGLDVRLPRYNIMNGTLS